MARFAPLFLFTLLMITAYGVIRVSSMKSGRATNGSKGRVLLGVLWLLLVYTGIGYYIGDVQMGELTQGLWVMELIQILIGLGYLAPQIRRFLTVRLTHSGQHTLSGAD